MLGAQQAVDPSYSHARNGMLGAQQAVDPSNSHARSVRRTLRPQDSNLDLTAPKAVVLPLHQGGSRAGRAPPVCQSARGAPEHAAGILYRRTRGATDAHPSPAIMNS